MNPVKRHDREERQMLHSQEEFCLYGFIFIEAITGPLNSIVVRDDYTHIPRRPHRKDQSILDPRNMLHLLPQ
jgi:hypothetical protein